VDENGDKLLTYNEFRKGCRDFVSLLGQSAQGARQMRDRWSSQAPPEQLSDSDIRFLFNFFDKNGDGNLSYVEVVSSLQVLSLSLPLSSSSLMVAGRPL
jgi:hypothetical protein